MNRRGVFQLLPTELSFRYHVGQREYVTIARKQFAVLPASTRIVYAAQGETWDAVVADLQRPPRMQGSVHWLACYVMLSRARTLEGFLA